MPECIDWKYKSEEWESKQVYNQPSNMLEFSLDQEYDNLQTIPSSQQHNRNQWEETSTGN